MYAYCLKFCRFASLWQGFWRGNVPALLMVMPYTAIQFAVLHKLKTFASGSSKTGTLQWTVPSPMHDKNMTSYRLCYIFIVIWDIQLLNIEAYKLFMAWCPPVYMVDWSIWLYCIDDSLMLFLMFWFVMELFYDLQRITLI